MGENIVGPEVPVVGLTVIFKISYFYIPSWKTDFRYQKEVYVLFLTYCNELPSDKKPYYGKGKQSHSPERTVCLEHLEESRHFKELTEHRIEPKDLHVRLLVRR
jgi:hypothetical protein